MLCKINEYFVLLLSKLIKKSQISSKRRCKIHKTSKLMAAGQYYDVNVGQFSYVGYGASIVNCSIGSYCSIADDVHIGGGAHPLVHVSTSPTFHSGNNVLNKVFYPHHFEPSRKTKIYSDVWVGYGAIIKTGVTIGTGAVVGAGSVVTKDVPPYEIWAGNPAKKIRSRFPPNVVEKLLASNWWEMPDEWVAHHAPLFSDVEKFLEEVERR